VRLQPLGHLSHQPILRVQRICRPQDLPRSEHMKQRRKDTDWFQLNPSFCPLEWRQPWFYCANCGIATRITSLGSGPIENQQTLGTSFDLRALGLAAAAARYLSGTTATVWVLWVPQEFL